MELGRFPIYCKLLALSAKYWHRLKTGCKNILLNDIYDDNSEWADNVKYTLISQGKGNLIHFAPNLSSDYIYLTVKKRLEDQCLQVLQQQVDSESLELLSNCFVHRKWGLANYLETIHNIGIRTIITKLRTNWYAKTYKSNVTEEEKLCQLCKLDKCTTVHMLLRCPDTATQRSSFLNDISQHILNIHTMSEYEQLNLFLNKIMNNKVKNDNLYIVWNCIIKYFKIVLKKRGW